jgi:hypothetical protein
MLLILWWLTGEITVTSGDLSLRADILTDLLVNNSEYTGCERTTAYATVCREDASFVIEPA